jgi:transposase
MSGAKIIIIVAESRTMMGKSQQVKPKLFYHSFSIESRVPKEHVLRKVKQLVDFDFIRSQVEHLYGANGHVSIDPAVILKLMFISIYYNIKSERALMEQLPLRLDWLWFCGYDLDEQTPDHSVLSKARRRWGQEAFSEFFAIVLGRCIEAGLVDGSTIHIDSSMIDANASKDSLKPQLRIFGQKLYKELDEQVEADKPGIVESEISDDNDDQDSASGQKDVLESRVSTTDPDARLGRKCGQSTLGYKDHRVIDDKRGIVTVTITTPANIHDGHVLAEAVETHQANTDTKVKTVVADKGYGIAQNYKYLKEHDAKPCIPHPRFVNGNTGKFSPDQFTYDNEQDCFICPAGRKLTRFYRKEGHKAWIYRADRVICEQCGFFSRCVSSPTRGRQVQRSDDVFYFEWADSCLSKTLRKHLLGRRKYKAEGSFADAANNHGYKRARWRGRIAVTIQNLMVAAIQNLRKLLRSLGNKAQSKVALVPLYTHAGHEIASKSIVTLSFRAECERILTFLKSLAGQTYIMATL